MLLSLWELDFTPLFLPRVIINFPHNHNILSCSQAMHCQTVLLLRPGGDAALESPQVSISKNKTGQKHGPVPRSSTKDAPVTPGTCKDVLRTGGEAQETYEMSEGRLSSC